MPVNLSSKLSRKKTQKYTEAEISYMFKLDKIRTSEILTKWLDTNCTLTNLEHELFEQIINDAKDNIDAWNEEELKMNFIAYVIGLSHLKSSKYIRTFYERTLEAKVEGVYLKTKTDFMIAKGILDLIEAPYFHFQEYKKSKDPNGDPLGQLLEAFLIAQTINASNKPIYGAYIIGRFWYFVVMDKKQYCVSKAFDSTEQDGLINIISILRNFKVILENDLMV
jgi:hypothetical protein